MSRDLPPEADWSLDRIADVLERIADALEQRASGEGTMDTAADRQVRPVLHNRAAYNCREHRPHDAVLHGAWCLICGEER